MSQTDFWVRSVMVESAEGNSGVLYVAQDENSVTTLNRHVLYGPGDYLVVGGAEYANLDAKINLRELWVHGNTLNDRFVISYIDITPEYR